MSRKTVEQRFWEKVDKSGECWEWTAAKKEDGYGVFSAFGKSQRAHRVAWELTNGPIPDELGVLHTCDNPRCVRPEHLYLGTDADNANDRVIRGRQQRGERAGIAKLNSAQVVEIRALSAGGMTYREIAKNYGVSHFAVGQIVLRKTWAHVGSAA